MKRHLSIIMALILAVSTLSTIAVMNVHAEEYVPTGETATITASGTSDTSSDGHITITSALYDTSDNHGTNGGDGWLVGGGASNNKALTISWDEAVNVTGIELNQTSSIHEPKYYADGATLSTSGDVHTLSSITKNPVTFTINKEIGDNYTIGIKSAVITYTLKPSYTVTFDANGHGTAPDSQTVYEGCKVKLVEPTADGYVFSGWYKETECTNAWDFSNDKVNEDTTLYAKWTVATSKSDDSSNESKNESNTTTETETVTPQIQGVNVNGMQLNSWSDINNAMAKITSSDLSTAQAGTAASMLQINISGSTNKIIPADTINLAGQASAIKYMHVFIGDGEAVTFDTNGKRIKNYKSTDFSHKDTVNNSTKTITFKTNQKIGTSVILHTTAPVKNAKYNVYYVDANGKRTLISITKSTGAGAICFPISQTGTFVMELAK